MTHLPPDQAAWLPVAERVIAGHYRDADKSTKDSLMFGLETIPHPTCVLALEKLKGKTKSE